MKNDFVFIGQIVSTFGIKGELKVYSESDFLEYRFREGATIYINKKPYQIRTSRFHKKVILITINDINNINDVISLVGSDIYAESSDMPVLQDNEYYVDDLIGLKVYNQHKEYLGVINDFLELPSGMIMEVIDNETRMLIPFVDEYIIDINDEYITINEIEGLR